MIRLLTICAACTVFSAAAQEPPTMGSVLEASTASDWRQADPANTLYMQLDNGRVVFELAPRFAPEHVANIRKLVNNRYYDGIAITRSQDNYVVQWGDPNAGKEDARSLGDAAEMLDGEFFRDAADLAFTKIDSRDAYANEVGFSGGFPAGRDHAEGRAWLTHCYGMLGVGRANSSRSGNGAELYVVTGHAPRHLDRNVTLIGRVIDGIEHLTALGRGTGPLGFYADASNHVPIQSIRFGSDLPQAERLAVELLRTDTATFERLIEARRHRTEAWFVDPADHIGICNVPLPVRPLN
jgi:peptidylprolyl isomerase